MRMLMSVCLMVLLSCSAALAKDAAGTVTMQFDLSAQPAGEEVKLWIPYPTTNEWQSVSNIQVKGDYVESAVYTDAIFGTPMLYMRWDKDSPVRTASFRFDVQRKEIRLKDLPTKSEAWNSKDFAMYLAPTSLGPVDGVVKTMADDITKGQTTLIGKARAIYDWMCENTYRNPETRGCGKGDVCYLIKDPGGKCADLSSLYIALLRASGVPAREIFGIRQGKNATQDITTWQHCWAEFYIPGYGWIPADPADVRKMMLKEKLSIGDPKMEVYREYYWAGLDPYRIKLGEGRDLQLTPAHKGAPINYLMYPYAQVGGKTLDWLAPTSFKYNIGYTKH